MRPSDIDDGLIAQVTDEFKRRRGLIVDIDKTIMLVDILKEWLATGEAKKVKK